jgi:hypothetical protein
MMALLGRIREAFLDWLDPIRHFRKAEEGQPYVNPLDHEQTK